MKQAGINLQSILLGMFCGVLSGTSVYAEDLEIYSSALSQQTASTANILFSLDTSGSMSGTVTTFATPYDPTRTYLGCFNTNRLYTEVRSWGRTISSVRYTGPQMYCHPSGSSYGYTLSRLDQFNASAFTCDAATSALGSSGFFIDRVAQYRSNRWRSVNGVDDNNLTRFVECKADQGIHGQATGDGQRYSVNGSGGWKSGSGGALSWNWRVGSTETVQSGNYLNYQVAEPPTTATRLRIMQDALTDVINASKGINIGLMRYSTNGAGGMVVTPMGPIDTVKPNFLFELEKMYHNGSTPLAESYYEAVAYMQGGAVDYGNGSTVRQYINPAVSTATEYVNRNSAAGSRTVAGGALYKSPISDVCQKNYIVLLTDGQPSSDNPGSKLTNIGVSGGCSAIGTSSCLEEIADSIASNDQGSITGDQFISTFTIGLNIASAAALLQGTASASRSASGIGEYYAAEDAQSLTAAFSQIVTQVLDTDTTFSSPAVSVNAFNRSTHLDDLYFTLFKPGEGRHWDGNLKKYKLRFAVDTADVDGDGDITERLPFIAGVGDVPAIDPATGFFKDASISYWTDTTAIGVNGLAVGPDGKAVTAGGARSALTTGRNVYTITGGYTDTRGVFVPATQALDSAVNAVDKTNVTLTEALLGVVGAPDKIAGIAYRETLLDWAKGIDVFDLDSDGDITDAHGVMGDPLHSEPALVQYGEVAGVADLVAYVSTNDGYLHAFDVDDGTEVFSFIPQELLTSLSVSMENTGNGKLYGMDGNVVAWIDDVAGDGKIDVGTDHVYLYIGMRRGGKNIYALDVTVRTKPKLLWVIKGGVGDYAELGDTWSTVNVEKIKDGAAEKTVLVFGGGYDVDQDNVTVRTNDDVGRAVFIADAETGERLWTGSASGDTTVSEMNYSIPARVKPLDISGDGYIDRLYATDMGGQVLRFDIDNTNGVALSASVTGGRIADLADSGTANVRRFYYPPDVALIGAKDGKYHSLVLSSGFRAHPLNTAIHDRIYMLKDRNTGFMTTGYSALTESDLHDATANIAGGDGANDAARNAEIANIEGEEGWYVSLDNESTGAWEGEKGLSEALILEGTAIVTTYVPDFTPVPGSCAPQAGLGKVFFLDIQDATPAYPQNIDKRKQRHVELTRGGIPPSPSVIITEGGEPTLCFGTECQAAGLGLGIRKTYWYEVEK